MQKKYSIKLLLSIILFMNIMELLISVLDYNYNKKYYFHNLTIYNPVYIIHQIICLLAVLWFHFKLRYFQFINLLIFIPYILFLFYYIWFEFLFDVIPFFPYRFFTDRGRYDIVTLICILFYIYPLIQAYKKEN